MQTAASGDQQETCTSNPLYGDPQTLNLYAYVLDDPLSRTIHAWRAKLRGMEVSEADEFNIWRKIAGRREQLGFVRRE
jgi:hypothetical protein